MLVAAITQKVLAAASIWAVRLGALRFRFPAILVDLPCTFFSIQTKLLPAASIVARHFVFSQRISSLAGLVIERIWLDSGGPSRGVGGPLAGNVYNGIHLRMEADAADWATILGGPQALLQLYVEVSPA
jgi:hypothetical protein